MQLTWVTSKGNRASEKSTHSLYVPKWILGRVERRLTMPTSEVSNVANNQSTSGTQPTTNEVKTKHHIVIPCTIGLCKRIRKVCSRFGIQVHFKGNSTIKNLLVYPRTRTPWKTKVGPSTGSNVGTLHVMKSTQGRLLGPLENDSVNT